MAALNVEKVDIEELFKRADLLSLHLPLTAQTKHFVGSLQLKQMKPTALLINTARGGLIDTKALALNLDQKTIASAGLDVYELEPLEKDHPIKNCGNALLTSHVAWYSEASIPRLQRLAAEEIVRALSGYPVKNPVTI
jgi:D-3-phosphoglycerate dehydrogenase